jgi:hypothetical protein
MTLLNHIGVLVILFLVIGLAALFDKDLRKNWYYSFPASFFAWIVFEAFYWTIKIFF